MKISVGLLAYNSERWIAESAGCLQPYVDEVHVLIDDLTNDHTAQILDEMKISYSFRTWTHDYAAAKNALIDKLTGDWIIILDDDEKLSINGANNLINRIRTLESNPDIQGVQIARKHHYPYWTTDENDYLKNLFPDYHIQAFKKGNHYTGIIHEGVILPPEQVIPWDRFDACYIHHHAWKGNKEKYELAKHNYYKDLSEGKTFEEGRKPF